MEPGETYIQDFESYEYFTGLVVNFSYLLTETWSGGEFSVYIGDNSKIFSLTPSDAFGELESWSKRDISLVVSEYGILSSELGYYELGEYILKFKTDLENTGNIYITDIIISSYKLCGDIGQTNNGQDVCVVNCEDEVVQAYRLETDPRKEKYCLDGSKSQKWLGLTNYSRIHACQCFLRIACPVGCIHCSNERRCEDCKDSFQADSVSGTCFCDPDDEEYIESVNLCEHKCPAGMYRAWNDQCFSCSYPCTKCESASNICTACPGAYELKGTTCKKKECKANCLTCSEESENICTSCKSDVFKLKDDGSCICIEGYEKIGEECYEICEYDHFRNPETNECDSCDVGCLTCDKTECFSCKNGYLIHKAISENGEELGTCGETAGCGDFCEICALDCSRCQENFTPIAYDIDQSKSCACSDPSMEFISEYGGLCLEKCQERQYRNEQMKCAECSSLCKGCQGSKEHCISCDADFELDPIKNECFCNLETSVEIEKLGQCKTKCQERYFMDSDGECLGCDEGCKECQGTSTNCTSCESTFILRNGTCFSSICSDSNCLECDRDNSKVCYDCKKNFVVDPVNKNCTCDETENDFFESQSKCLLKCEPGLYRNELTTECMECNLDCEICESLDKCLYCTSGLFLHADKCLEACPSQMYSYTFNRTCNPCSEKCLECQTSAENCIECPENYNITSQNTCELCDENLSVNWLKTRETCPESFQDEKMFYLNFEHNSNFEDIIYFNRSTNLEESLANQIFLDCLNVLVSCEHSHTYGNFSYYYIIDSNQTAFQLLLDGKRFLDGCPYRKCNFSFSEVDKKCIMETLFKEKECCKLSICTPEDQLFEPCGTESETIARKVATASRYIINSVLIIGFSSSFFSISGVIPATWMLIETMQAFSIFQKLTVDYPYNTDLFFTTMKFANLEIIDLSFCQRKLTEMDESEMTFCSTIFKYSSLSVLTKNENVRRLAEDESLPSQDKILMRMNDESSFESAAGIEQSGKTNLILINTIDLFFLMGIVLFVHFLIKLIDKKWSMSFLLNMFEYSFYLRLLIECALPISYYAAIQVRYPSILVNWFLSISALVGIVVFIGLLFVPLFSFFFYRTLVQQKRDEKLRNKEFFEKYKKFLEILEVRNVDLFSTYCPVYFIFRRVFMGMLFGLFSTLGLLVLGVGIILDVLSLYGIVRYRPFKHKLPNIMAAFLEVSHIITGLIIYVLYYVTSRNPVDELLKMRIGWLITLMISATLLLSVLYFFLELGLTIWKHKSAYKSKLKSLRFSWRNLKSGKNEKESTEIMGNANLNLDKKWEMKPAYYEKKSKRRKFNEPKAQKVEMQGVELSNVK